MTDRLTEHLGATESSAHRQSTELKLAEMRRAVGRRIEETFGTTEYKEIGRLWGGDPSVVAKYVKGERFPSPEYQIKFHEVTGRSIHWLMFGVADDTDYRLLFSAEDALQIEMRAVRSGRTFAEEVRALALAGISALKQYEKPMKP